MRRVRAARASSNATRLTSKSRCSESADSEEYVEEWDFGRRLLAERSPCLIDCFRPKADVGIALLVTQRSIDIYGESDVALAEHKQRLR